MRKYKREWVAKRRAAFFSDKFCVRCGSSENLELDHIDPSTKTAHAIWSWTESRRFTEIAKCQILCHRCHVVKTAENGEGPRGERHGNSILTERKVLEIRRRIASGERQIEVARDLGLDKRTINDIHKRKSWDWLTN